MSTSNLKISIAALSLSAFSFTAGQYLPYVIAAVSGSGTIVAVPLAIFAVSAVVALISATYLIKLAGSRADNKKEAGPNGKEFGHTASQESQKFVCESCTNLENRSSVPTLTPPPVTLGIQPNPSPPPPPPPPFPQGAAPPPPPSSNGTSSSKNASSPSDPDVKPNMSAVFNKITQQKPNLMSKEERDKKLKEQAVKKSSNKGSGKRQNLDLMDELGEKIANRRKGISGKQEDDVESTELRKGAFNKMSAMIPPPRNRSSSVLSDSGNVSDDEDWETDPEPIEQASSGSQSLHRERSGSLDSGHGSDDNVKSQSTPPPHSAPKADKPLISPKPVNLKTKSEAPPAAQVNNVDPVNSEVQESSTSSLKDRIKLLNLQGGSPVFPH